MGRVHLTGDCRASRRQLAFSHQLPSGFRPLFEPKAMNERTAVTDS